LHKRNSNAISGVYKYSYGHMVSHTQTKDTGAVSQTIILYLIFQCAK